MEDLKKAASPADLAASKRASGVERKISKPKSPEEIMAEEGTVESVPVDKFEDRRAAYLAAKNAVLEGEGVPEGIESMADLQKLAARKDTVRVDDIRKSIEKPN